MEKRIKNSNEVKTTRAIESMEKIVLIDKTTSNCSYSSFSIFLRTEKMDLGYLLKLRNAVLLLVSSDKNLTRVIDE